MLKQITVLQERDSCLALAFLLLIIWCYTGQSLFAYITMAALFIGMICPKAMRPFAAVWYGFASLAGKVSSAILLSAVWFFLVTPVGIVRRVLRRDPLLFKQWKKGGQSCFITREHAYRANDLKHPY